MDMGMGMDMDMDVDVDMDMGHGTRDMARALGEDPDRLAVHQKARHVGCTCRLRTGSLSIRKRAMSRSCTAMSLKMPPPPCARVQCTPRLRAPGHRRRSRPPTEPRAGVGGRAVRARAGAYTLTYSNGGGDGSREHSLIVTTSPISSCSIARFTRLKFGSNRRCSAAISRCHQLDAGVLHGIRVAGSHGCGSPAAPSSA